MVKFQYYISFFSMILLGLCANCKNKDYFSAIMAEHTCIPGNPTLSDDCKASILAHAPIDQGSFSDQQDLLKQVIAGIHVLLTAPIRFPADQKLWNIGTLKEAQMYDFLDHFGAVENANQALVNYVLNASPVIEYGCTSLAEATAYYTPNGIHICTLGLNNNAVAALLLHEARHSETGPHTVFCPNDSSVVSGCDQGVDEPYGWEIGLSWGLLQGGSLHPMDPATYFNRDGITDCVNIMVNNIKHIYALPEQFKEIENHSPEMISTLSKKYLEHLPYLRTYPVLDFSAWQLPLLRSQPVELVDALPADWDGDGHQELLLVQRDAPLNQAFFTLYTNTAPHMLTATTATTRKGEHVWAVRPIDWNHDTYLDLVYVYSDLSGVHFAILIGGGGGRFVLAYQEENYQMDIMNPGAIQVLDVDGDGEQDVVALVMGAKDHQKSARIFFRQGAGFYSAALPVDSAGIFVAVENNDASQGVVVGTDSTVINLFVGPWLEKAWFVDPSRMRSVNLWDLDHDHQLEFALSTSIQGNWIVTTFLTDYWEYKGQIVTQNRPGFMDLNRDGILDVVSFATKILAPHQTAPVLRIALGFVPFTLTVPFEIELSIPLPDLHFQFLHADLNYDGWEDVIAFNPTQSQIIIFWNDGENTSRMVW